MEKIERTIPFWLSSSALLLSFTILFFSRGHGFCSLLVALHMWSRQSCHTHFSLIRVKWKSWILLPLFNPFFFPPNFLPKKIFLFVLVFASAPSLLPNPQTDSVNIIVEYTPKLIVDKSYIIISFRDQKICCKAGQGQTWGLLNCSSPPTCNLSSSTRWNRYRLVLTSSSSLSAVSFFYVCMFYLAIKNQPVFSRS